MIFSSHAEQFNIRRCRAMCNISVLNNSGLISDEWVLVMMKKEKIKTLGF